MRAPNGTDGVSMRREPVWTRRARQTAQLLGLFGPPTLQQPARNASAHNHEVSTLWDAFISTARAMKHVHAKGVANRDFHAGNVLVGGGAHGERTLLIDFSSAEVCPAALLTNGTSSNNKPGTVTAANMLRDVHAFGTMLVHFCFGVNIHRPLHVLKGLGWLGPADCHPQGQPTGTPP